MKMWTVTYSRQAEKDFSKLHNHQRILVRKAIKKVSVNPLPFTDGGYGIPLGNKHGFDLSGLNEIKLKGQNLRVIYRLYNEQMIMENIMIGKRSDLEVYSEVYKRLK